MHAIDRQIMELKSLCDQAHIPGIHNFTRLLSSMTNKNVYICNCYKSQLMKVSCGYATST